MEQELAGRVDDDRALVADERIVEAGRLELRQRRSRPSARSTIDHVQPGVARGRERRERARAQHASSPISVRSRSLATTATSRGKPAGSSISRQPRRRTRTRRRSAARRAFRSKAGIEPPPFVTCASTVASSGRASSRFGPTEPVAPASASVWQLPQFSVKTALPAAGSPCRSRRAGTSAAGVGRQRSRRRSRAPCSSRRPPPHAATRTADERRPGEDQSSGARRAV